MTAFTETDERRELRKAVAALAAKYGQEYFRTCAKEGRKTDELWQEAGKLGFIGVNLPEEFGGGGAGMYELSIVMEEIAAAGTGLLMLVVSPAICGNIIVRYGTDEQKQRWVPGLADGSYVMAFGITEPDAGSNSHTSPPPPGVTGPTGCSAGRRCSSPVWTRRIRYSSSPAPRTPRPANSNRHCSWCPPTHPDSPAP